MKSFSSKLFFMSKSDSEKFTQISSKGAAVSRQVMEHIVRNPCKISLKINQSSEGATEIISAVLTGL